MPELSRIAEVTDCAGESPPAEGFQGIGDTGGENVMPPLFSTSSSSASGPRLSTIAGSDSTSLSESSFSASFVASSSITHGAHALAAQAPGGGAGYSATRSGWLRPRTPGSTGGGVAMETPMNSRMRYPSFGPEGEEEARDKNEEQQAQPFGSWGGCSTIKRPGGDTGYRHRRAELGGFGGGGDDGVSGTGTGAGAAGALSSSISGSTSSGYHGSDTGSSFGSKTRRSTSSSVSRSTIVSPSPASSMIALDDEGKRVGAGTEGKTPRIGGGPGGIARESGGYFEGVKGSSNSGRRVGGGGDARGGRGAGAEGKSSRGDCHSLCFSSSFSSGHSITSSPFALLDKDSPCGHSSPTDDR